MKKKLFAIVLSVLSLTVNAQDMKNELFVNGSQSALCAHTLTNETNSADFNFEKLKVLGFALGYNRIIGISETMPLQLVVGAKLKYEFDNQDNFNLTTYGEGSIFRCYIPTSVKMAFSLSDKFAIEPYVGFNASLTSNNTGYGGNKLNIGWQCGLDICVNKFVVGVEYLNDIFRYRNVNLMLGEKKSAYWSGLDVKLGYRF
ncbi:MAG: hypothetical protein K6E54_03650 [Bacteroidaceae bacterium]|nr:hypothetical protein [Bacteroidaceae bacterium]